MPDATLVEAGDRSPVGRMSFFFHYGTLHPRAMLTSGVIGRIGATLMRTSAAHTVSAAPGRGAAGHWLEGVQGTGDRASAGRQNVG
jgi:hypothetical protein